MYRDNREIINLTGKHVKMNFNNKGLKRLVMLPDYSPERGLGVGSVTVFNENHRINRAYLGTDVGCGMSLYKLGGKIDNIGKVCEKLSEELIDNNEELGKLGGGNHFITFYNTPFSDSPSIEDGRVAVLIHSGSGRKGGELYCNPLNTEDYLKKQKEVIDYAKQNRSRISEIISKSIKTPLKLLFDRVHNSVERNQRGEIVYRKGAVYLSEGEEGIIPSSMAGQAVLVSPNSNIRELEDSIPHGTGRKYPRGHAKTRDTFEKGLPNHIYFPIKFDLEYYNSELPENYRSLDEILEKMEDYIKVKGIFQPRASIMI